MTHHRLGTSVPTRGSAARAHTKAASPTVTGASEGPGQEAGEHREDRGDWGAVQGGMKGKTSL